MSIVDARSANAGSGRTGSTGIAPVTCQGTREPVTAIVLTDAVTRGSGRQAAIERVDGSACPNAQGPCVDLSTTLSPARVLVRLLG